MASYWAEPFLPPSSDYAGCDLETLEVLFHSLLVEWRTGTIFDKVSLEKTLVLCETQRALLRGEHLPWMTDEDKAIRERVYKQYLG